MTRTLYTLLLLLLQLSGFAQNKAEQPKDTIDRSDPNFVRISVLVADPTDVADDMLGILGHSFIRMQCPTFNKDYVFSYESENVEEEVGSYLAGSMKMGMFRMETDKYLKDYHTWKRAVHEYELNLPPEVKTEMWRVLDKKADEGNMLPFDLMKRGCTSSIVDIVESVLPYEIEYGTWPERFNLSRREIMQNSLKDYPWASFLLLSFCGDAMDENCSNEEKIILPEDLVDVWTKAKVEGRTLLTYKGDIVSYPLPAVEKTVFTPIILMLVVLAITIVFAFLRTRVWDWVVIGLQTIIGLLILYLALLSELPTSGWWLLMIIYNPLPALLWKWRKYWATPYSIALIVFCIAMICWPHRLIEIPHLIFALSLAIIFGKDKLKKIVR